MQNCNVPTRATVLRSQNCAPAALWSARNARLDALAGKVVIVFESCSQVGKGLGSPSLPSAHKELTMATQHPQFPSQRQRLCSSPPPQTLSPSTLILWRLCTYLLNPKAVRGYYLESGSSPAKLHGERAERGRTRV